MFKKMAPVLLLTFVNTLGFSLLIPVLPFILRSWGTPDWTFGILLSTYSLCQFWAAPIFGQLSDQYGRRIILLWSQAGTLISWLLFIGLWLIDSNFQIHALWLVVFLGFSRIIDGMTGGNSSVTNAYLSDITTKTQKATYFGYVSAVMGLGMVIGPAIGAYTMATKWGYLSTAIFGSLLSLVTLFSIWFLLKESLTSRAPKVNIKLLSPFRMRTAFKSLKSKPIVQNVMVVKLFLAAAMAAYTSIMVFFLIDQFNMNEKQIGNFLFFVGGFAIFNQIFMIKPIVKLMGEGKALASGLALITAGLTTFPLITNYWVLIIFYYFSNLGFSLSIPTIKAVITSRTDDTKQGSILGLEESANSLMFGIMPIVSTSVYSVIASNSFFLWAGLSMLGLIYLAWSCPMIIRLNPKKASISKLSK